MGSFIIFYFTNLNLTYANEFLWKKTQIHEFSNKLKLKYQIFLIGFVSNQQYKGFFKKKYCNILFITSFFINFIVNDHHFGYITILTLELDLFKDLLKWFEKIRLINHNVDDDVFWEHFHHTFVNYTFKINNFNFNVHCLLFLTINIKRLTLNNKRSFTFLHLDQSLSLTKIIVGSLYKIDFCESNNLAIFSA